MFDALPEPGFVRHGWECVTADVLRSRNLGMC